MVPVVLVVDEVLLTLGRIVFTILYFDCVFLFFEDLADLKFESSDSDSDKLVQIVAKSHLYLFRIEEL